MKIGDAVWVAVPGYFPGTGGLRTVRVVSFDKKTACVALGSRLPLELQFVPVRDVFPDRQAAIDGHPKRKSEGTAP